MQFQNYLKSSITPISEQIDLTLNNWLATVAEDTPKLLPLAKEFIAACQGGKRLRGLLVKLGYELAGGKDLDQIYKPAAAFEIFQTAILAHDDIIDQSPTRRGRPTIYHALGGDHYGVSQTISLGDIGFFLSLRLIADSKFPDNYKNQAIQSFCTSMLETASGQMMDVMLPTLKGDQTEEDALLIFRFKTARYTISGPLQLGAILAGTDENTLGKIQEFGDNLGIAFQIQDDILGVFGEEETIGKSNTSDIEEGKITLLFLHALQNGTDEQKKVLADHYGKGHINAEQLSQIRQIMIETGSLDYSKKLATKYIQKSIQLIPEVTAEPNYQNILTEMSEFLVKRDK